LAKIKESHLKELHKHHVSNFFSALAAFSHRTKFEDGISEWTVERELQLALKFVTCPYFEKKLKGIAFMISILEKTEFVLKSGLFRKWSQRVNLCEVLFLNNDNPEFIKKACELAKYLKVKNNLEEADIDLILKSRAGKHETVVKEIYTLVA
jgi:hypothetical protein